MLNQQKGVQQDTAYSAVVVNGIPDSPSLPISVSMTLLGQKCYRDGDTFTTTAL